jgi:hypothetical protein
LPPQTANCEQSQEGEGTVPFWEQEKREMQRTEVMVCRDVERELANCAVGIFFLNNNSVVAGQRRIESVSKSRNFLHRLNNDQVKGVGFCLDTKILS